MMNVSACDRQETEALLGRRAVSFPSKPAASGQIRLHVEKAINQWWG
jgi:hypothetical protein